MGRYDFRPSQVRRATAALLAARPATHPPRWFQAASQVPRPEILTRTLPIQHSYDAPKPSPPTPSPSTSTTNFASYPNPADFIDAAATSPLPRTATRLLRRPKRSKRPFQPLEIAYEEDELRTEFFTDHPWELARPRVIVEEDGNDHHKWDWSLAHQPGRPVSGESVIQRQLYLMRESSLSKAAAYDKARKEFYEQRHRDEVERRVAREEANAVGATSWGLSANEIGMLLENKTFEQWKAWANGQVILMEQAKSAVTSGGAGDVPADSIEEAELQRDEPSYDAGARAEPEADISDAYEGAAAEVAHNIPGTKSGQTALGGAMFVP